MARRHVAEAELVVHQQMAIVEGLHACGLDTGEAETALENFRKALAETRTQLRLEEEKESRKGRNEN